MSIMYHAIHWATHKLEGIDQKVIGLRKASPPKIKAKEGTKKLKRL